MDSVRDHLAVGFPHSEIHGSKPARGSPWLIATCYVLHRLSVPRHPPNALIALDPSYAGTNPRTTHFFFDTMTRKRTIPPLAGNRTCAFRSEKPIHDDKEPARSPSGTPTPPEGGPELLLASRTTTRSLPPPRRPRKARELVEANGIEPMTSCLQSRRSPN